MMPVPVPAQETYLVEIKSTILSSNYSRQPKLLLEHRPRLQYKHFCVDRSAFTGSHTVELRFNDLFPAVWRSIFVCPANYALTDVFKAAFLAFLSFFLKKKNSCPGITIFLEIFPQYRYTGNSALTDMPVELARSYSRFPKKLPEISQKPSWLLRSCSKSGVKLKVAFCKESC